MGWLKVMLDSEEEKIFWHSDRAEEVALAREKFIGYKLQGFLACKIVGKGQSGVQIAEFDPEAEEIFMLGMMDGG